MSTFPEHPLVCMHARASHPETRDGTALAWIPDPTAASSKVVRWSYRELWSVASNAAAEVRRALEGVDAPRLSDMQDIDGLSPTVGLLVEDGVELPVAILAILLAGGAVVPLGANDPPARIKDVLDDAGCSAAIASDRAGDGGAVRRLREALTEAGRADFTVISVASLLSNESRETAGESTPPPAFPTNKLSHVFFTSGSTGRPKGCLATHGGLSLYCDAKNQSLGVSDDSVVLVASPHSFDPSLGDFLGAWRAGCVAATAPRSHLFASMGACLAASGATHVLTTPSMLSTINPATDDGTGEQTLPNLPNLRVVALGGEPMPEALARAWLPAVRRLVNGYGVTECTVYQAFRDVTSVETRRAVGPGLAGCEMLLAKEPGDDPSVLLDENREPDGTLAEVWFAGPLVGLGYANAPALTAERYSVCADTGRRFFRTGDVCRLIRRGGRPAFVEIVGRRDSQVKINGQRVELGEVEAAVCASAPRLVAECAVSTPRLDAAEPRSKAIVAWCVSPPGGCSKTLENARPTVENANERESYGVLRADALRWLVASRVPPHMVPSRFGRASFLPTTATGKAARSVVAKWGAPPPPNRDGEGEGTRAAGSGEETEAAGAGFEPVTSETRARGDAFARVVASAWSAELGAAVTSTSRFAELGGDSVAALRVCQAIAVSLADDDASPAGTMRGRAGGTFGEALVGALAPARVLVGSGGNLSLAAHVAALRSAAIAGELGERAAELARGDLDDDDASVATKRAGDGDGASAPEVDERTEEGASLLRRAAFEGDAVAVEQLVDAGVHVEGAVGVPSRVPSSTPLHVACGGGSRDRDGRAAAALLSRGASPRARNRRGQTAFIVAAARGPNSLLAQILERGGDAGAADDDGQTALHVAARAGAPASVVAAVAAAADGAPSPITMQKNARNENSRGPKANSRNDKSRGEMARRYGGGVRSVDRRDAWGRTPLHWAAVNGHRAACVALLDAGASASAVDNAGETPTAAAERRALCSARERPDGARASTWGDIATLLGGSGRTKHLKAQLAARASKGG